MSLIRSNFLPLAAAGLMLYGLLHVARSPKPYADAAYVKPPSHNPFVSGIAASGLIEPQTENIRIGAALPGIVKEVCVTVGLHVKKGDPLVLLDDRQVQADLKFEQAGLTTAETELTRLNSRPRPEEVPAAQERVRETQAQLAQLDDQRRRTRKLYETRAVNAEQLVDREQAYHAMNHQMARAQADLDLLKAGAWEQDKAVAESIVSRARLRVEQVEAELARLAVTAPIDGVVLQVNVRPGEYVSVPPEQPLILLGGLNNLHVRVSIDEHDIPRFRSNAPAYAFLKGLPEKRFKLLFVGVEPYVMPKRSLSGNSSERIDTRALDVIYSIRDPDPTLFIGQQMDVYFE